MMKTFERKFSKIMLYFILLFISCSVTS